MGKLEYALIFIEYIFTSEDFNMPLNDEIVQEIGQVKVLSKPDIQKGFYLVLNGPVPVKKNAIFAEKCPLCPSALGS